MGFSEILLLVIAIPFVISIIANVATPWFQSTFKKGVESLEQRRKDRKNTTREIGTYLAKNHLAAISFHLSYQSEFRRRCYQAIFNLAIIAGGITFGIYNVYLEPSAPPPVNPILLLIIFPGIILGPFYFWFIATIRKLFRLRTTYRDILDFVQLTLPLGIPLNDFDSYLWLGFIRQQERSKDVTVEDRIEKIKDGAESRGQIVIGDVVDIPHPITRNLED